MSKFDNALEAVRTLEMQAVYDVIDHYGGMKKTAEALGVTEGSIRNSLTSGRLGRYVAFKVAADPNAPFTLKDLRADHRSIELLGSPKRPGPNPEKYI